MSKPTQQELHNAKDNLSNYYDLMDDLQMDFTDIMNSLTNLLSHPTDDPGQSAMNGIITGLFDVFGIAAALGGMPAAGPIAGLGALITKSIVDDPPPNLHVQFANFQARFVKNIHDVQDKLGSYSDSLVTDWNLTITNPATNKSFKLSDFGEKGFVPGKKSNLGTYNKYRKRFRNAAKLVSWKYFIPIVYVIGVRDDSHPDGPMSAYSCSDCWPTKESAIDTFRDYITRFPASYFKILSFKDKCKSGGGTHTVYDYWSLNRGENGASKAVCSFLFKDDGFGNIINTDGLTTREDVFQKWGMKKKFMPGIVSYGSNCELVHANTAAAIDQEEKPVTKSQLNVKKDWSAQIVDFITLDNAQLEGANFEQAAGDDLLAQNANLERANFNESRIAGANFRSTKLQSATFVRADLGGADFRAADLRKADFTNAFLRGADFTNARVEEAVFENADLNFTKGLSIKNNTRLVPQRHQQPSADKNIEISYLQKVISNLAKATETEKEIKPLKKIVELLSSPVSFNYHLEASLSEGTTIFSLILKTAGPVGALQIAKLMQAAEVKEESINKFSSKCKNAYWPACGIRINNQDQHLDFEPFISGPMGWSEISGLLSEKQGTNRNLFEYITKVLDTQSIYLWGWNVDNSYDSIGLRVHPQNWERIDGLTSHLGIPPVKNTALGKAIANSSHPAILFVQSSQGQITPALNIYLPISSKRMLVAELMDNYTKGKMKKLLALQKVTSTKIRAIKYSIDGHRDGNRPIITAYF